MNLALNGRNAMPSGGTTIAVRNAVINEASDAVQPGEYVALEVSDTGTGIPEDVLGQVFDPCFATEELGQGTGIGLATCHAIAKQANGDIQVESRMGSGTTLTVWLPRGAKAQSSTQIKRVDPAALGGPETVLVVEGDRAVLQATAAALAQFGYRVLRADGGEEALRRIGVRRIMSATPTHRSSSSLSSRQSG
jgi:hypothetical protein